MNKKRTVTSVSILALAAGLANAPLVLAQTDYTDVNLQISTPSDNATVGSVIKVNGAMDSACQLSDSVYLEDNVNSGSINYRAPYDPKGSHSYSISAAPVVSGNTFTYTIDLSKAYWNREGDLIPQVPQPGQAEIYVSTNYTSEQTCYGSASRKVTIQYPEVVQPTQAQKPKPVPSAIAQQLAPTSSPSPSVKPVMATPTAEVKSENNELDPMAALLLGALLGAAILALAEVSAVEYRKKHGLKGDVAKRKQ